jgi:hypothetical protein
MPRIGRGKIAFYPFKAIKLGLEVEVARLVIRGRCVRDI